MHLRPGCFVPCSIRLFSKHISNLYIGNYIIIAYISKHYCILLILVCNEKNMQTVSTVSSSLHIMIRHNDNFCKKRAPLHASDNFSFELFSIADDENE